MCFRVGRTERRALHLLLCGCQSHVHHGGQEPSQAWPVSEQSEARWDSIWEDGRAQWGWDRCAGGLSRQGLAVGPQRPLPRERKELQGHHGPFAPGLVPGKKRGKEPGAGGKGSRHHIHAALPPEGQESGNKVPLVMHGVRLAKTLSRHSLDKTRLRGASAQRTLKPSAATRTRSRPPVVGLSGKAARARRMVRGWWTEGKPHAQGPAVPGPRAPAWLRCLPEPEEPGPGRSRRGRASEGPSPAHFHCWRPRAAAASPPAH